MAQPELRLIDVMRAATMLQNPLTEIQGREGELPQLNLNTGPVAPHTGRRSPASVEQSEGKTPAVITARAADRENRRR